LSWADLQSAKLEGINLEGANLRKANLKRADLSGANLRKANLKGANLEEANLKGANLKGANLSEANLRMANLEETLLEGKVDISKDAINKLRKNNREMVKGFFNELKKEVKTLDITGITGRTRIKGDAIDVIDYTLDLDTFSGKEVEVFGVWNGLGLRDASPGDGHTFCCIGAEKSPHLSRDDRKFLMQQKGCINCPYVRLRMSHDCSLFSAFSERKCGAVAIVR
jgi:uncharacterized protein YjbI with pentapeptide repeats